MSDLRTLLLTTDTVGGVFNFTLELAEALRPHGVEVVAAALGGPPSATQRAEASLLPNLHLLESNFKLEWMDDPWPDVEASGRWLLDLEEEYAPQVVHLNSYGHGAIAWRAPVVLTAHSCVLSWWSAVRRTPLPAAWDRYRGEVEYSLRAADVVTAPTRAMLRSIEENYGPNLPAARVVPNGRSVQRYGPARKEPFLFAAGRLWDEAKNIAAVARIAPRVGWPIYVAGDQRGVDLAPCRGLGRLSADQMADWYARASVYVHPARYEPFGLAPLEAALSGCALVLGDLPSLREVWGDAALFVSPGDDEQLEFALSGLIADADHRYVMAQRASQRAREFTAEKMGDAYLNIYRTVIEQRRVACAS